MDNKRTIVTTVLLTAAVLSGCSQQPQPAEQPVPEANTGRLPVQESVVRTGAERTGEYLHLLMGKRVAIVANQTSVIGLTHLVDSLLALGIDVKKVFAAEHGFRGDRGPGEKIDDGTDAKTGLPIVSLYGSDKKPSQEDLADVDIVMFDIQDVGARFYTYISTLHYVMEACAELGRSLIVLDRPNPNGHYVDGPVLEESLKSFVGMHPVPIAHGMTVGEYALMINGEGWLAGGRQCALEVIACTGWDHKALYELPVPPSPNLPNMAAVYLYPSLCLFEGTAVSVGRGTDKPFQQFGHPYLRNGRITFTPKSIPGVSANPKFAGETCRGFDVAQFADLYIKNSNQLYLFWLRGTYDSLPDKAGFFDPYFDMLAGTAKLREQIVKGVKEEDIRKSWQPGIAAFKAVRKKYLLYADFE